MLQRPARALVQTLVVAFATIAPATILSGDAWATEGEPYINFETIPTRALAMSPDGSRLFVTNTPDSRLEIFDVSSGRPVPAGAVTVGLDPIAVAARNDDEVWVVNHLSDSVSVVDLSSNPRVVQTLFVGDEPRDIVFAGPDNSRAFVTAARRGQNHPDDVVNETQVPGLPRADVWVFDANDRGDKLGGEPLAVVPLFADKPGALAITPDGSEVYVSIFSSGNQTTTIIDLAVCGSGPQSRPHQPGFGQFSNQEDGPCTLLNGGTAPGGVPGPNGNQADGAANPRTGIIVKFDPATGAWLDAAGRDWRDAVPFSLPDNDVFVIDALANPPAVKRSFNGVGTLNFNVSIHPISGKAFVSTIEAINTNRFISAPTLGLFPNPNPASGVAATADPLTGHTLNGHLYESRVSILNPADRSVVTRHLNKHIDYEVVPSPPGVKERSIANPQGLVFSADGETLFIAGLGSNEIVPFSTRELEDDSFVPDASTHITLSGDGGPTDMVIGTDQKTMFAYRRFDNAISTVDLETREEVASTPMFSPEPAKVTRGRKFLYDARLTSSNGEANCNVCHPSGDKDDLAWNLGSPFFGLKDNINDFVPAPGLLSLLFPDAADFNQAIGLGASPEGLEQILANSPLAPLAELLGLDPSALLDSEGGEGSGLIGDLIGVLFRLEGLDSLMDENGALLGIATVSPTLEFNPLKGPMTVLTLRGLKDSGPMFWRGDANSSDPLFASVLGFTPNDDPNDERKNFQEFNIVFPALLGREAPLDPEDFEAFTDFILTLIPPPNPHRPLSNELNASQAAGEEIFLGGATGLFGLNADPELSDLVFTCEECHGIDRSQGFFGTRGQDVIEGETQFFKVPQLRSVYDKVGGFGTTAGTDILPNGEPNPTGPQVRGTGVLHDGSAQSPRNFLSAEQFQLTTDELTKVVDFTFAFPTNLAPVVGQQVTLSESSGRDVQRRIDLLRESALDDFVLATGETNKECDLIAKGQFRGRERGYVLLTSGPARGRFLDDEGRILSDRTLRRRAQSVGNEVTFTCVYPGGGRRLGVDRDGDGRLDGNER